MKNEKTRPMIRVAMFASGSGTNVENFIGYFKDHPSIEIALVVSNNPGAFVLERARQASVAHLVVPRAEWKTGEQPLKHLKAHSIDFIVLAGFLQLIPSAIIREYDNRIINIHPALLPSFGGKGMYGMRVHQAVIDAGETRSGISIHLVNEKYDEGQVLFQKKLIVAPEDTPETLARKVHQLEYEFFPSVVEKYIFDNLHELS